ncbi:MAG TPA: choice-of-anchor B family protein [Ignavibacteriaceae bacterium]|nr:choice-of-anchor B family protein [Ignavibacteriaceae bacterium]
MKLKTLFLGILLNINSFPQLNVELISNLNQYSTVGYNDIWGYVDQSGYEYALLGTRNGTSIINLSNPANPVESAFIPGPQSTWRDIKVHSHYAYIVTEGTGAGNGLQIVDLSQLPSSATLVNTLTAWFERAHNIFIDNGFAFVIGTNGGGGMHILDLADPVNPVRTAYYTQSGYIHDVYVWDDTVVAMAESTYDLIDISNKSNPLLISVSAALPGIYAHSGWMTEDKRYFIGTEEFDTRDITVWDLQDRTSWDLVVPSWQMTGGSGSDPVHNLFVKGNYAHISYYKQGYVVLDISDPENPLLAGHYDTYPSNTGTYNGAWGCYPYLPSGLTLISDMQTGLYVLEFTPDDTPPFIDHTPVNLIYNTDPVALSATIIDNNLVADVKLYFRTVIDSQVGEWNMISHSNSINNVYDFEVPSYPNRTKVEYYLAAVDNNDLVSTLPEGGSGINPPGNIPPSEFFNYIIKVPGYPILVSFNPLADTSVAPSDFFTFTVEAVDTSDFNLTYKWFKNGSQVNSTFASYNYIALPSQPVPRVDSVRVEITNSFFSIEKSWNVSVDNPSNIDTDGSLITYQLDQNYPNPFNPSTNISYAIPNDGTVNISVFNSLGEKVSSLVNEFKNDGIHNIKFNAIDLPSGIYFVRMTAGEFSKLIKMNLIK